jgi:hypothetical protein
MQPSFLEGQPVAIAHHRCLDRVGAADTYLWRDITPITATIETSVTLPAVVVR